MAFRIVALMLALIPLPAFAGAISLDGITFLEASDNIRLVAAGGSGTLEDPYVIQEEILGEGEAIIKVRIDEASFGSRLGTTHAIGFALRKEVTNRTARSWDFFVIELEFEVGKGSDYYDGLSFAQSTRANRPFRSDRFVKVDDMTEPRDMIRFSDGRVDIADSANFLVSITHTAPLPEFYLVQHIRRPFAMNPSPQRMVADARSPQGQNTAQ